MNATTQMPVLSDRALFFRSMRRPEMHIPVKALQHLRADEGVDLATIKEMEIAIWHNGWMLITDRFQVVSLWPDEINPDFLVVWFHDEQSEHCLCGDCQDARNAFVAA